MMFTRARRAKLAGFDFAGGVNRSTSAVPSQLLPTKTTGVVVAFPDVLAGADAASAPIAQAATAAVAAAAMRRFFSWAVPPRPRTIQPPVGDGRSLSKGRPACGGYQSRGFPSGIRSMTRLASTRSTGYGVVAR